MVTSIIITISIVIILTTATAATIYTNIHIYTVEYYILYLHTECTSAPLYPSGASAQLCSAAGASTSSSIGKSRRQREKRETRAVAQGSGIYMRFSSRLWYDYVERLYCMCTQRACTEYVQYLHNIFASPADFSMIRYLWTVYIYVYVCVYVCVHVYEWGGRE